MSRNAQGQVGRIGEVRRRPDFTEKGAKDWPTKFGDSDFALGIEEVSK